MKWWMYFAIIILAYALIMLIAWIYAKLKERVENLKARLNSIASKHYTTIKSVETATIEFNNLTSKYHRSAKRIILEVGDMRNKLAKQKIRIRNEEKEAKKERRKQEKEREKREAEKFERAEKIEGLITYFCDKGSSESIPDWAINFTESMIKEAQEQYSEIVEEQKREEELKKQAEKFVSEHQAYPSNFCNMNEDEQEAYHAAMELLKKDRLEPEETEDIAEEDKELLSNKFYHADSLKQEEKEKLTKQYGYRHKLFIHRDGTSGNNLIIKKTSKSESDYHFCMKHLFAEIDPANAKIEHAIGDSRADVAFIYHNGKIAVEIETGTNKEKQIQDKIEWLNEHFDYWIFVCSRKNKKNYKQYVDNEKSFCLTLKEADMKVQELIEEF